MSQHDPITPDRVSELLELITPGPWHVSKHDTLEIWANRDPAGWDAFFVATLRTRLNPNGGSPASQVDAAFIALGPEIAQAYLADAAEVERLRAELAQLRLAYNERLRELARR
jgi:hypothetical protein